MAKFQKKPPIYDALQFNDQATAKTIIENMATLAPDYSVRFLPASSEFGLQGGVVTEFKAGQRLRIESTVHNTTWFANTSDWVMVSRDGLVTILTNASFTEQYQPA